MKCLECEGNNFEMNERLGELSCVNCGLIAITELFEQTVSAVDKQGNFIHSADKTLGSKENRKTAWLNTRNRPLEKGLRLCNMLLATLSTNHPLKDRVEECYISIYRSNVLTTLNLEEKATAVVYYVLRENRTPVALKQLKEEFSCDTRTLNKAIKRLNKHFRNINAVSKIDPYYMLNQVSSKISQDIKFRARCQDVLELFEPLTEKIQCMKGTVYYASICWIANNIFLLGLTQQQIADKVNVNSVSIRRATKKLLSLIGYEKCSEVKGKQINELRRN